ncbi:LysR family transcriptional regulator [Leeia sp.]|uniref:LysR family transcriptional regulator n=1 Tax=Leeia sp. TaxID=2884678 RepID=UPI0035B0CE31
MLTLQALQLFVHVAEHGSFASAASRFGLTPSTVTRQIQQLEQQLDSRLLHRSTRSVALTEAGRHFLPHALAMLDAFESGSAVLNRFAQQPSGILRLTAPHTLTNLYLAPALPSFLERYPQVKLDLQQTDDYINLIEAGFDLGIRQGTLHDSTVVARPLFHFERILCASPQYLARHGQPRQPADLEQHNCIPYNRGNRDMVWQFQKGQRRERITPSGNMQSNCTETLRSMTLAGMGICRFVERLVAADLGAGRLVRVLPDWQSVVDDQLDTLFAVYPQRRMLSSKVAAFLDHLQQWLQTHTTSGSA